MPNFGYQPMPAPVVPNVGNALNTFLAARKYRRGEDEYETKQAKKNALAKIAGDPNLTDEQKLNAYKAIDLGTASKFSNVLSQGATRKNTEADRKTKALDHLDRLASGATPENWSDTRRRAIEAYPELGQKLPAQYDPNFIAGVRQRIAAARKNYGAPTKPSEVKSGSEVETYQDDRWTGERKKIATSPRWKPKGTGTGTGKKVKWTLYKGGAEKTWYGPKDNPAFPAGWSSIKPKKEPKPPKPTDPTITRNRNIKFQKDLASLRDAALDPANIGHANLKSRIAFLNKMDPDFTYKIVDETEEHWYGDDAKKKVTQTPREGVPKGAKAPKTYQHTATDAQGKQVGWDGTKWVPIN